MPEIFTPKRISMRVQHTDDGAVALTLDDRALLIPWQDALQLSIFLRKHALLAESKLRIPQMIADQALLVRKGVPIALTDDERIVDEARNEAAFNHELRKTPAAPQANGKLGTMTLVGKGGKDGTGGNDH